MKTPKNQSYEQSSFNDQSDKPETLNLQNKNIQNRQLELHSLDFKYKQLSDFINSLPQRLKTQIDIEKQIFGIQIPRIEETVSGSRLLQLAENTIRKMKNHKRLKKNWNKQDLTILLWISIKYNTIYNKQVHKYTEQDWERVSQYVPGKTGSQCMFKWLGLKKLHLTEHPWTLDEQMDLKKLVEEKGQSSWPQISQQLYLIAKQRTFRSAKQCRQHWTCYVNPNLKKGLWRPDEDLMLLSQFIKLGKKWAEISKVLNGRTENAIKNRFNLLMQKEGQTKGNVNPIYRRQYALKIIHQLQTNHKINSKIVQDSKSYSKKQNIKFQEIQFFQQEPIKNIFQNTRQDNYFQSQIIQQIKSGPSTDLSQFEVKVQNQQQSIIKKVKFCKVSLEVLMQMQGVIPAVFDRDKMEIFINNNQ